MGRKATFLPALPQKGFVLNFNPWRIGSRGVCTWSHFVPSFASLPVFIVDSLSAAPGLRALILQEEGGREVMIVVSGGAGGGVCLSAQITDL